MLDAPREVRRRLSGGQPRPLNFTELIGNVLFVLACLVDHDGQQESLVGCDEVRPVDRELPFESEVPLGPLMSVFRNEGNKERAGLDLLADRLVPSVSAPQLALVEPDLDARSPEGLADALRSLGIFRRVAQEDSQGRRADAVW